MNPLSIEQNLEQHLSAYISELENALRAENIILPDLLSNGISEAILYRMRSYYQQQWRLKDILHKQKITPAPDFFVETIMFYLKAYFSQNKPNWTIRSEVAVKKKRGALRPDITIWEETNLVAAIECKTQLGWNRFGWREQHIERKRILQEDFPEVKSFLLVMTNSNWNGFADDLLVGKEFFTLCSIHPGRVESGNESAFILNPIEHLISQL